MVDEDKLNMQVRKFLKEVGVTSQREIERAVLAHRDQGDLSAPAALKVVMTLRIEALDVEHVVEGSLHLDPET